jgi:hypothetical protein
MPGKTFGRTQASETTSKTVTDKRMVGDFRMAPPSADKDNHNAKNAESSAYVKDARFTGFVPAQNSATCSYS